MLRGRPRGRLLPAGAGLLAVAAGLPHLAYVGGHPAQVAVPVVWIVAAHLARGGRPVPAALVLGAAGGSRHGPSWGAPVLLLWPRLRGAAAGSLAQAEVIVALFVPFVLAGDFRMLEYEWEVAGGTLPSLLVARARDLLVVGAADVLARRRELLSRGQTPGRGRRGHVGAPNSASRAGPPPTAVASRDGFVTPV